MFDGAWPAVARERDNKALGLARKSASDPERIVRAYRHQLSGGQRQRAMIATALALEPTVLVAESPPPARCHYASAILRLIPTAAQPHMAVMFITHDFGVVAISPIAWSCCGMDRFVEQSRAQVVLTIRSTPNQALLAAVPSMTPPQLTPLVPIAQGGRRDRPRQDLCHVRRWFRPDARFSRERSQLRF